jgi:hypothetical protein
MDVSENIHYGNYETLFLVLLSKKDLDSVGTTISSSKQAINSGIMERRYFADYLRWDS